MDTWQTFVIFVLLSVVIGYLFNKLGEIKELLGRIAYSTSSPYEYMAFLHDYIGRRGNLKVSGGIFIFALDEIDGEDEISEVHISYIRINISVDTENGKFPYTCVPLSRFAIEGDSVVDRKLATEGSL